MHISARAVIKIKDEIILIHRIKEREDGSIRDYYVTPGGKVEENEKSEDAVVREVYEEVGIKVKPIKILTEFYSEYNDSIQRFYECEYIDGEIGTGTGPEYTSGEYKGFIKPELIKIENIKDINLVPEEIKQMIGEE